MQKSSAERIFLSTEFIQKIARVSLSIKDTTPVNWFVIHLEIEMRRIYWYQIYV